MKTQAAKLAPKTARKEAPANAAASLMVTPLAPDGFVLQRKACACGGSCPRCDSARATPAKLAVSQPGDRLEREADRVADRVMRMPQAGAANEPNIARDTVPRLSRHAESSTVPTPTPVPSIVHDVLRSSGESLDAETRTDFGARFGRDFDDVRIHTDASAAASARAIHADAYTVGNHIAFARDQYRPFTSAGRRLLAHELTHVLQQNGPRTPTAIGSANDAAEREADGNAARAEGGSSFVATAQTPGTGAPIRRFSHTSSCTATNLRNVVWPGDYRMRQMVAKAIRVLSAAPINPLVTALFPKYFMTSTPPVATILGVFNAVQAVITANNYTYECEDDCGPDEAAYVRDRLRYIGINPNIHLCLNHMTGYLLPCNASLILHEFTHYAAHLDDESRCGGACTTTACPSSLSASDALDNSYSFANFALELDPMAV